MNYKKVAFTLAEVLITLGVIGVVAAMTIPGLVSNIQSKVTENQRKVANARLVEGLNMLNIKDNGLSVRYNNTEEFVRALGKHMKLVQICGSSELNKCFPYESINYDSEQGQTKQVRVDSLTSAQKLKLYDDGWLEPAGFITANGIPYIISFNNNCSGATDANGATIIDPDKPLPCNKDTGCQVPYQCIDGIYDLNGSRTPNKMSKDVETIHSASVYRCVKELDDFCFVTKAFRPEPISYNDCETKYKRTLVNACYRPLTSDTPSDNDQWLGGMVACQKAGGHMPDRTELAAFISSFYSDSSGNHPEISGSWNNPCVDGSTDTSCQRQYAFNRDLITSFNLPRSGGRIWSSLPEDAYGANGIYYNHSMTISGNIGREGSTHYAICIGD